MNKHYTLTGLAEQLDRAFAHRNAGSTHPLIEALSDRFRVISFQLVDHHEIGPYGIDTEDHPGTVYKLETETPGHLRLVHRRSSGSFVNAAATGPPVIEVYSMSPRTTDFSDSTERDVYARIRHNLGGEAGFPQFRVVRTFAPPFQSVTDYKDAFSHLESVMQRHTAYMSWRDHHRSIQRNEIKSHVDAINRGDFT